MRTSRSNFEGPPGLYCRACYNGFGESPPAATCASMPGGASAALVNLVGEVIDRREVDVDTHDQRSELTTIHRGAKRCIRRHMPTMNTDVAIL